MSHMVNYFQNENNALKIVIFKENSTKKNHNFARIAKRRMNFWADQKNTKLSLTFELINNVFADLPI